MERSRTSHGIAGIGAILVGLLDMCIILYAVATPAQQRYSLAAMLEWYTEHSAIASVNWTVLTMTGILSLGLVLPMVYKRVRSVNADLAMTGTALGALGFGTLAVNFATLLGRVPLITDIYVNGDALARSAVVAAGLPELDPGGWILFGMPGLWALIVNALALKGRIWPRWLAVTGFALGAGYLAAVPGSAFGIEALNLIAASAGAVSAVVWFVGMGIVALRDGGKAKGRPVLPE